MMLYGQEAFADQLLDALNHNLPEDYTRHPFPWTDDLQVAYSDYYYRVGLHENAKAEFDNHRAAHRHGVTEQQHKDRAKLAIAWAEAAIRYVIPICLRKQQLCIPPPHVVANAVLSIVRPKQDLNLLKNGPMRIKMPIVLGHISRQEAMRLQVLGLPLAKLG